MPDFSALLAGFVRALCGFRPTQMTDDNYRTSSLVRIFTVHVSQKRRTCMLHVVVSQELL
jgi:hypothetical protein